MLVFLVFAVAQMMFMTVTGAFCQFTKAFIAKFKISNQTEARAAELTVTGERISFCHVTEFSVQQGLSSHRVLSSFYLIVQNTHFPV